MSIKEKGLVPKVFTHSRFGKLRIVVIDGVAYFVAKDVAVSLGYKNTTEAIRYHVDPLDKREEKILSPGGVQSTTLINKSGVYSLILDSQLPKAKEYRHWVTSEVLPTIDETGSYSPVNAAVTTKPLHNPNRRAGQLSDARVYVFRLSDGEIIIVKIGQSKDVDTRKASIERKTKKTVKEMYYTPLMPRKIARLIEQACHEIFSSSKLGGEFFSIKFEEACKVISSFVKVVACLQVTDYERGDKLLAIAEKMSDTPERHQILISSAKLIAGK